MSPGLSRQIRGPPRAGAGASAVRSSAGLVEVGERVKKDQPPGRTRSPRTCPATWRRRGSRLCREGQPLDRARRVPALPHAPSARPQPGQPFPVREHPEQLPRRRGTLEAERAEFNVADNQAGYAVALAPGCVIASRRVEVQVVAAGQTVLSLAADGEREVLIGPGTQLRNVSASASWCRSNSDRNCQTLCRGISASFRPGRSSIADLRPPGFRRPRDSGRTGPERAGQPPPPRRCRYRFLVGADRRGRPAFVWVNRAARPCADSRCAPVPCRGPCAGARRPEGWRLGWPPGSRCFAKGSRCVRSTGPTAR